MGCVPQVHNSMMSLEEMLEVDDGSDDRNIFRSFERILVSRKIVEESIFVWLSIEDEVSLVLDSTSGSEKNNSNQIQIQGFGFRLKEIDRTQN